MNRVQIINLPAELKESGLFCCWRYETRVGSNKPTKVPYNPHSGSKAQSNNPDTFTPFPEALAALEQGEYDGIGVGVFDNLGAIDIDHCIGENGEMSAMATDVMDTMNTYNEYSPSGKGLRILFTIPEDFQYDTSRYYINNQNLGIEVYISGATSKYVTVTGNSITPGYPLEERGEQLITVLEKYMVRPQKSTASPVSGKPIDLNDAELIANAKRSKNGAVFDALWSGDITGYQSHSEADMALCNMLAFWTNKDAARMDKLFRQSGLMRDKWGHQRPGGTYGTTTIQKAIDNTVETYNPQRLPQITVQPTNKPSTLAALHPEKNERYGWNDIGNGYLFADWYKDTARYVPERKKWFIYNGKVWEPDNSNLEAMELCKQLANELVVHALSISDERQRTDYLDFVRRWQRRNYRETVLKDAASVYPVKLADFDQDLYLFNCLNGTLDLRTREFRPHSPADMLATISGVKYDPAARSELWEQTVNEVMERDAEKAVYLQKSLGYGLTGDTSEESFFVYYGATTRNGKGTVMETYMKMQGGYGKAARPETIAQKDKANSNAPTEDIARLAGARAVNISEPGKQMVLSAALVKTLTGRDTITARFLNENSFQYVPQFKLYINTNYLPKVTDTTIFDSGRVKVIPFNRHFTEAEQDKDLKQKLAQPENLSGLLNWCLEGLWLMQETGLDMPASVAEATAQYRRDSDKIMRFIEEMMEPDIAGEIRTEDAYKAYQSWCECNGQRPGGKPNFKHGMEAHTDVVLKRPKGAGRNASKNWFILGKKWRCGQPWTANL